MKKYNVGIIGATGMVGQRFCLLLADHPWFNVTALAASSSSAGKVYEDAVGSRWAMTTEIPANIKGMPVLDAEKDIDAICDAVDFVFCAVNMKKDEIKALEETYAKRECPVISNNSAHRFTADVPISRPIAYFIKKHSFQNSNLTKLNCSTLFYTVSTVLKK